MRINVLNITAILMVVFLTQCNQPQTNTGVNNNKNTSAFSHSDNSTLNPVKPISYHALVMNDSGRMKLNHIYDTNQQNIIFALNRIDKDHALKTDTLIIPDTVQSDLVVYSPFPQTLSFLNNVNKIIFFSYPAEAFAAYEHGKLLRWGPTNMGRQKDSTPTGLTYANWKKLVDTSSVKDEWILKWNVNIFNKEGIGFHEYDMPGYPASHSCLRLNADDAQYLYNWVDEWKTKGENKVIAHGTPVIIFGSYPFGSRKPWRTLLQNPNGLDISADYLQALVQPNLQQILAEQQKLNTSSEKK